jgi:hypothetical protein
MEVFLGHFNPPPSIVPLGPVHEAIRRMRLAKEFFKPFNGILVWATSRRNFTLCKVNHVKIGHSKRIFVPDSVFVEIIELGLSYHGRTVPGEFTFMV